MTNRTPPYMVALSGWPEPVYIAGPPLGSSRDGTPGLSGEYREGISSFDIENHAKEGIQLDSSIGTSYPGKFHSSGPGVPSVPPESIFSRTCMYNNDPSRECQIPDHPNHIAKYAQARPLPGNLTPSRADSPSFPTSSTRGTPHPSPPVSRKASPKPSSYPRHSSPLTLPTMEESDRDPRARSFADPRYAPHVAVMSNRPALPLAPSWGSSSVNRPSEALSPGDSTPPVLMHPHSTGVGVRIAAGQRGTGILVMRAVPDVYPPPASMPGIAGMAAEMTRTASQGSRRKTRAGPASALEVATEVYPRDPDRAILWGSGVPSRKTSMSSMSRRVSETRTTAAEEKMEIDER